MEYGLDKRSNALKIFNTTFIIVWLLVACFPFIWTFWGSFKVRADFFSRASEPWELMLYLGLQEIMHFGF